MQFSVGASAGPLRVSQPIGGAGAETAVTIVGLGVDALTDGIRTEFDAMIEAALRWHTHTRPIIDWAHEFALWSVQRELTEWQRRHLIGRLVDAEGWSEKQAYRRAEVLFRKVEKARRKVPVQ
jgi:hypothetical protein